MTFLRSIRARVRASVIVAILIIGAALGSLAWASVTFTSLYNHKQTLRQLTDGLHQLSELTVDLLDQPSVRATHQWQAKHGELGDILLSVVRIPLINTGLESELRERYRAIGTTLLQIRSLRNASADSPMGMRILQNRQRANADALNARALELEQRVDREIRSVLTLVAVAVIAAVATLLALVVALYWMVSASLLRPILQLRDQALQLGQGSMETPLESARKDEVGDLFRSFEEMRVNVRDTTHRLTDERARAEQANMAKSDFLASMSHELRSPLNTVVGYADVLEMQLHGPIGSSKYINYIKHISVSGKHLLAVINDILDFARIESGQIELEESPFYLDEMMSEIETLMLSKASEKRLNFSMHVDALPGPLLGDLSRLRQVLTNIVDNAVKFTETGRVAVRADLDETSASQVKLRFTVADTGVGMSHDMQVRLFERFYQGDSKITRRHGGTGLGLAISKLLLDAMGGTISVESEEAAGTTFTMTLGLPLASATLLPIALAGSARAGRRFDLSVLVADDIETNRTLTATQVESLGCRAETVKDGAEAVALLRRKRFDLVLMDIHMPNMDGITATQRVRSLPDETLATIPIYALTADAIGQRSPEFEDAGLTGTLSKPLQIGILRDILAAIADGPSTQLQPASSQGETGSAGEAGSPDSSKAGPGPGHEE